ncbi:MAG: M23 family metallopeptidase [Treponema sp.]|nr:M23 family metallopeptidase [Treponema sp.]
MNCLQKIILFLFLACAGFPGAAEDLIHVVTGGDTIYSLSRFYGVNADDLMRANNITDPSKLFVGKRLIIPSDERASSNESVLPSAVTSQPAALVDYRAQRGDTLYGIARSHGITLQNLLDINRFSSGHVLRAGDVVKVPGTVGTQNVLVTLRWPVNPGNIAYMTGQMGVVIDGEQYESVRSITSGSVVSAGPWRKFGRLVIVEAAGGYFYMYGGCQIITVNVGDRVTPGMELGRLGINTVSEKPQLFFMVFRGEIPLDPALAPRS